MGIITKADLINRTRVIKAADVKALLGDDYVKAYNRGYAGSQRGTDGTRYQDDGVAFAGWEAYEVGTDKWNDDYTQDALLAVLGRAEVEAEQHAGRDLRIEFNQADYDPENYYEGDRGNAVRETGATEDYASYDPEDDFNNFTGVEVTGPVTWAIRRLRSLASWEPSVSPIPAELRGHEWLSANEHHFTSEGEIDTEASARLEGDWTPEERAQVFQGATARVFRVLQPAEATGCQDATPLVWAIDLRLNPDAVPAIDASRARFYRNENGIVQYFASQADQDANRARGAYQLYAAGDYRTYALDGSSLGLPASEDEARALVEAYGRTA
jgi:hypothetical protein